MRKQVSLPEVENISRFFSKKGAVVGLVTGCFDILHTGHIRLLQYAKKHSDIVIVALENDTNIAMAKGPSRPVLPYRLRSRIISELESVDYLFQLGTIVKFGTDQSRAVYSSLYQKIVPYHVVTERASDRFWKLKKEDARMAGSKLLMINQISHVSTTKIIEAIKQDRGIEIKST